MAAACFEKLLFPRGIELQNLGAELKALGPLCPTTAGIFAFDSENGRAILGRPGASE